MYRQIGIHTKVAKLLYDMLATLHILRCAKVWDHFGTQLTDQKQYSLAIAIAPDANYFKAAVSRIGEPHQMRSRPQMPTAKSVEV